jgi:signal transduction histidine kinase
MSVDREEEQDLVSRLNQAAITAAAVAGSLSMLIAIFLAYRLLRPVRDLSQSVQKLGAGDLSERAPIYWNDEIAVLARNFNHMADSLQDAEHSRRAMTADIAHELRNPLAVQRANLEALQDGIYPLTPENLEPVMEQNILLSRLVDDLRTLALADAGRLQLERSRVNLATLLGSVVDRYNPQANKNNVEIIKKWPSDQESKRCVISVDSVRIEQVIGNLLSNALRYTPTDGKIRVSLVCSERKIDVDVHDSGPGIAEDSLNYVFERFYRGDTSRSREAGGTGLGLAIARQLAEAHGGELKARNHPDGGAQFTMSLPLTQDD